jgi:RNA polymerase-interacting CarD/CdnL/TRCF family regulator
MNLMDSAIAEMIRDLIESAAEKALTNEEKKAEVLAAATAWLNERVDIPLLSESTEAKIFGVILSALIEVVYSAWKQQQSEG